MNTLTNQLEVLQNNQGLLTAKLLSMWQTHSVLLDGGNTLHMPHCRPPWAQGFGMFPESRGGGGGVTSRWKLPHQVFHPFKYSWIPIRSCHLSVSWRVPDPHTNSGRNEVPWATVESHHGCDGPCCWAGDRHRRSVGRQERVQGEKTMESKARPILRGPEARNKSYYFLA